MSEKKETQDIYEKISSVANKINVEKKREKSFLVPWSHWGRFDKQAYPWAVHPFPAGPAFMEAANIFGSIRTGYIGEVSEVDIHWKGRVFRGIIQKDTLTGQCHSFWPVTSKPPDPIGRFSLLLWTQRSGAPALWPGPCQLTCSSRTEIWAVL